MTPVDQMLDAIDALVTRDGSVDLLHRAPERRRPSLWRRIMVARASKRQLKLVMPVVPEHSIQRTLTKVLTMEIAPPGKLSKLGALWFSVDHANYAGEVPGVRVGRGMISGVPDIFVLYRGKCHLIELKAEDGGLTDEQKAVIAAARLAGCEVAVCDKMEQVLRALDSWGVPRKRRLMFPVPEEAVA